MSDHIQKIRAAVSELETELHGLSEVDDATRDVLKNALEEIQAALGDDASGDFEPQGVVDRLSDSMHEFEGAHPTLTGIISRLIDGLGQMGI